MQGIAKVKEKVCAHQNTDAAWKTLWSVFKESHAVLSIAVSFIWSSNLSTVCGKAHAFQKKNLTPGLLGKAHRIYRKMQHKNTWQMYPSGYMLVLWGTEIPTSRNMHHGGTCVVDRSADDRKTPCSACKRKTGTIWFILSQSWVWCKSCSLLRPKTIT